MDMNLGRHRHADPENSKKRKKRKKKGTGAMMRTWKQVLLKVILRSLELARNLEKIELFRLVSLLFRQRLHNLMDI